MKSTVRRGLTEEGLTMVSYSCSNVMDDISLYDSRFLNYYDEIHSAEVLFAIIVLSLLRQASFITSEPFRIFPPATTPATSPSGEVFFHILTFIQHLGQFQFIEKPKPSAGLQIFSFKALDPRLLTLDRCSYKEPPFLFQAAVLRFPLPAKSKIAAIQIEPLSTIPNS